MTKLKYLLLALFLIILIILGYLANNYYNRPKADSAIPTITSQVVIEVSPSATSTPTTVTQEPEIEEIFQNHNIYAVQNKPTAETIFALNQPRIIYSVENYHWNNGEGSQSPGAIGLKDREGNIYGPWKASGTAGQGGVPNAYWTCYPNLELPAGTYIITDSDPDTWSQNAGSSGKGMARVFAIKEK